MTRCDRKISLTMAASSYKKPIIGDFAKLLHVIPVSRPEDSKIKGKGTLKFVNPTTLKGNNTEFEEQAKNFKLGISTLVINNYSFIIDKIIDSNNIIVKQNLEIENVKEFQNKESNFEYYIIPKIDNKILFAEVYNKLEQNGCICIFPEGTSHDRTEFIKLKAGVALMALGAMADHNCSNINILPVGLNYFDRDKMRSEAIIEFGQPFCVPNQWAEDFKINKRGATEKLLDEIESVN